MKTSMNMLRVGVTALTMMVALTLSARADAEFACASESTHVKAVTISEDYFPVTTLFQPQPQEPPNTPHLQTLLKTTIVVGGDASSCVLAYFSAVAEPTDNYLVFQLSINGVPMYGHHAFYANPLIPIVLETEETDQNLPRMVAHHSFRRVNPGTYTIEVKVAAGSGVGPAPPAVMAPVLTVHYR